MNAVRFYSRSGNTKILAEAIAKAAGTEAVSVDAAGAAVTEPVDVLFVSGALYAYGLDSHLKAWLTDVQSDKVGKAVVFSTSWISKHALDLIRNALTAKGIPVETQTFYVKGNPSEAQRKAAGDFARKFL